MAPCRMLRWQHHERPEGLETKESKMSRWIWFLVAGTLAFAAGAAAQDKPNILVIWGDDIGRANVSHYTHGSSIAFFTQISIKRLSSVVVFGVETRRSRAA